MSLWWKVRFVSAEPEDVDFREEEVEVLSSSAALAAEEGVRVWLEEDSPPYGDVVVVVEVSLEGQPAVMRRVTARRSWRTSSEVVPPASLRGGADTRQDPMPPGCTSPDLTNRQASLTIPPS